MNAPEKASTVKAYSQRLATRPELSVACALCAALALILHPDEGSDAIIVVLPARFLVLLACGYAILKAPTDGDNLLSNKILTICFLGFIAPMLALLISLLRDPHVAPILAILAVIHAILVVFAAAYSPAGKRPLNHNSDSALIIGTVSLLILAFLWQEVSLPRLAIISFAPEPTNAGFFLLLWIIPLLLVGWDAYRVYRTRTG